MTDRPPCTLYHGDAMEVLPVLPPASIDLILTDPPYGCTDSPWDKEQDWESLLPLMWRVLKPNGAMLICAQMRLAAKLVGLMPRQFRYEWVWEKTNAVGVLNSARMPLRAHEFVLVFYKRLPVYNKLPLANQAGKPYRKSKPEVRHGCGNYRTPLHPGKGMADGSRVPRDVVRFGRDAQSYHPTQKPQQLCRYMVEQYTAPGATVLDPFAGSGSTLLAARETGRQSIGVELDATIYARACARLGLPACPAVAE